MTGEKKNPELIHQSNIPTTLDLYQEQARQGAVLQELHSDVKGIKAVLLGDDRREGLVMDVDRLKRTKALMQAAVWVIFTAAVGTCATLLSAFFIKG